MNGNINNDNDDYCSQVIMEMNDILRGSGVKIVHQNIRSLLSKIDELRLLISSVQSKIDLFTLSETWLTDDVADSEVSIEGYTFHRRDRGSKEKGGGLGIYVRNDLSVSRRFDLEQSNIESLWVEVNFPHSRGFLVGTFYQPPESSRYYNDAFMDHFEDSAEKAISNNKEVILLGDFNCNLTKSSLNGNGKRLTSTLRSLGFCQLIKEATRITAQSATLLDLIATNYERFISKSGVLNACLSDHDLVYCIRKMNCKRSSGQTKSFRNYARYNSSAFCDDLRGIDWEKQINSTLPERLNVNLSVIDRMWLNFKSAFISVVDRHAPVINKRVRGIDCPWLNGEIKKVMHERDKQSKIARKTNSAADWEKYKTLRNRVTALVKSAKGSYNRKLIEDNSGDPKSFWRTLTRLIPGKKVLPRNIKVDDTSLHCYSKIANGFNKFFVGTITRLTEAMGSVFTSGASFDMYWRSNTPKELFHFEEISENFTLGQLNKLKSKKAVGLDAIPTRLLKDSAEIIANPLTKIINFSLANRCVPSEWKEARVIPLFKSGKSDNMDNYRPVSILPVVSKILERAVHTQLYKFMVDNNLLSPYQSGFRKRRSTETACISFTDSIRRGMDQGMLTGSVFIDLRGAFDTVNHDLLLAKLHG